MPSEMFVVDGALDTVVSLPDFMSILNKDRNICIFIKDLSSNYYYGNDSFIHLMGLKTLGQLKQENDLTMSKDRHKAKVYRDLDCNVIEGQSVITVSEDVSPKYNQQIHKVMQGAIYPLFSDDGKVAYVMGAVSPKSNLLKLDWETVFRLSLSELNDILIKRSYLVTCQGYETTLSKMEIKTIVQLLRGQNASEIALSLQIKQTTVESYLKNIRNKFAVSSKSELINVLIRDNVLQQIVV